MNRNNALDGLRFLAITLVIASHSGFLLQGGLGNDIFFALSGLLAVNPFKDSDVISLFKNWYIWKYYLKRVIRIIPTFWCYLAFSTLFFSSYQISDMSTYDSLLLNAFFIKSKGHLWFIQQEMLFYVMVPFLLFAIGLVKRILKRFKIKKVNVDIISTIIFSVFVILVLAKVIKLPLIILQGNVNGSYFRYNGFLVGMMTGLIFKTISFGEFKFNKNNKIIRTLGNCIIIAFLLFCVLTSPQLLKLTELKFKDVNFGWDRQNLCYILACLTAFTLLMLPDILMSKALGNKFFVFISKISFCMYLFHWNMLTFNHKYVFVRFLLVYFITISISSIINRFIETPTIKLSKKITY